MTYNKDDEIVGFFPRKRLVISFLVVTMMLTLGTGFSVITASALYFKAAPETVIGILWFMAIFFCLVNFQVTRGSFLCAKILRYYALVLALIFLPSLFLAEIKIDQIYSAANVTMLLGAFFLMGGQTYQEFVRYQCNHFADLKEAREAVEKELNRNFKGGKKSG